MLWNGHQPVCLSGRDRLPLDDLWVWLADARISPAVRFVALPRTRLAESSQSRRVSGLNQFEYTYSISALADVVKQEATALGMPAQIEHLANPRSECEEHFYQPDREHLVRLGYEPHDHLTQVVRGMLEDVRVHRSRIEPYAQNMRPSIQWS